MAYFLTKRQGRKKITYCIGIGGYWTVQCTNETRSYEMQKVPKKIAPKSEHIRRKTMLAWSLNIIQNFFSIVAFLDNGL